MERMLSNERDAFEIRYRAYSTIAALTCLLLDFFLNLRNEYKYVMRPPLNKVKVLYLLSRYGGIVVLCAHTILTYRWLIPGKVNHRRCEIWYSFLLIACSVHLVLLDLILFLRIYAIYYKDHRVCALLIPIMGQLLASITILIVKVIQEENAVFTNMCDRDFNPQTFYLASLVMATQVVLWGMTFPKRNIIEGRELIRLVMREGTVAFLFIAALTGGLLGYSRASSEGNPFIIFLWPILVMSIASCRIVMSTRQIHPDPHSGSGMFGDLTLLSDQLFTSCGNIELETRTPTPTTIE